ncbi:MAG: ABC-2 transporter permease [Mobilitalea sp.]
MNKAFTFVRLDYFTVKPYLTLKNLIIFTIVAIIMMFNSNNSLSAIAILMVFAGLYVSYPFAVGEKNGIDALYITLSIQRSTVVVGRYLFALIINACAGLLAYVFAYLVSMVLNKDFNFVESFVTTLALFSIFSIIQAIQIPIYFKLGYAKAKFFAYLPFVGLPLVVIILTNYLKEKISLEQMNDIFVWMETNTFTAALIGVMIWLVIMLISLQTSLSFYNKREF